MNLSVLKNEREKVESQQTFGPHVMDPRERKSHKKNIRNYLNQHLTPFEKLILDNLDFARSTKHKLHG